MGLCKTALFGSKDVLVIVLKFASKVCILQFLPLNRTAFCYTGS